MAIPNYTNGRNGGDRRRGARFPIREAVQYKVLKAGAVVFRGTGTSVNFSSGGIEFTTESELRVGSTVEVSVDWPAKLGGDCALKFVGTGCVVRAAGDRAVVKFQRHEFRTRGKSAERPHSSTDAAAPRYQPRAFLRD